ncbi:MAG: hypothetical protein M1834_000091 [Cirrosporium novae-zelandiae]|nr:MAG: hypothetical protein M1834_000091 [Cirrosporium novae-zelandiae]
MNQTILPATVLYDLPNELLISILSSLETRTLLDLTLVSRRFHDIIVRVLHARLLHAASLKDHKLILECYHPSLQASEPYLFCEYLGTLGLSAETEGEGLFYNSDTKDGTLGQLGALYSSFRPLRAGQTTVPRPHPAGDVPGQQAATGRILENGPSANVDENDRVTQKIHLETDENFSQLCVVTNLVKLGPRRGVFTSCVNVSDDFVRVFRKWLANNAEKVTHGRIKEGRNRIEDDILWVGSRHNIGMKMNVRDWYFTQEGPIMVLQDDTEAISYIVEFDGMSFPCDFGGHSVDDPQSS